MVWGSVMTALRTARTEVVSGTAASASARWRFDRRRSASLACMPFSARRTSSRSGSGTGGVREKRPMAWTLGTNAGILNGVFRCASGPTSVVAVWTLLIRES